jgi:hypothetical protein
MSDLDKLKRLARVVRKAYEGIYGWDSDLGGACFDSSRQLFRLAKENGIPAEIGIGGDGAHAFVLLDDVVVDVTATQFGKRRKILVAQLGRLGRQKAKWDGCQPWSLDSRHRSMRSANWAWNDGCGKMYRHERRAVLKALRNER